MEKLFYKVKESKSSDELVGLNKRIDDFNRGHWGISSSGYSHYMIVLKF